MSQWQSLEKANDGIRDLARAVEEAHRPGISRMQLGNGFEMGPPMRVPSYAFWVEEDGKVRRYFEIPDPD